MPSRRADASVAGARELRSRGRQTRQRLLDAGVEVFASRGYHAARVDDIVKVAETSHGTFYLYFANKEELFRSLAEHVAAEMDALADALPAVAPGASGATALRTWLAGFTDAYERYGPVIRAWTEAEIGGSEFGRLGTNVLAGFTRVLVARISPAAPADVDPTIAALALVAMIERMNYYVLARQVRVGREAMLDALTAAVHHGLFGSDLSASTR